MSDARKTRGPSPDGYDKGLKVESNPLEQARQYAHAVVSILERDPHLLVHEEGKHKNRLCFPWGYGVVLANISRRRFGETNLGEVMPPDRVICQDELAPSVDPLDFQQRLWNMFTVHFSTTLTLPQVDRIRWHIFPEVRIGIQQDLPIEPTQSSPTVVNTASDLLKVMDLQQEQLARNLGEGHRVIHGVAGSGKTMILGFRCERLAPMLQKPILVLCYNRALAAKLRSVMTTKGLRKEVHVRTFHSWCVDQLRLYGVPMPPDGPGFFEAAVDSVIASVERGLIPPAQYGAVMIDEAHDFKPEWLKLVTQMVDPATNSLLVLYDDAQSIYEPARRRKFSFSSVGIQARGRTTILKYNYRNTTEILGVAYEFAKDYIAPAEADEDGVPLVAPLSAGRRGAAPILAQLPNLDAEVIFIARQFAVLNAQGLAWRDMAVLYRANFIGERIAQRLRSEHIPIDWPGDTKGKRLYDPSEDAVKLLTMHASKGLEFRVVAIPAMDRMPYGNQNPSEETKLLYVAMTRAMDRLVMTYGGETEFVSRVRRARQQIAA